jgi:hypothetical protein
LNLTANESLDRLVGRNMREIDVDAVLFKQASVLRYPKVNRIGGDDTVDGGGLRQRRFGGVAGSE